jgi:predicted nicotinamide N-methyase
MRPIAADPVEEMMTVHTHIGHPPLVPEIALRLAVAITPVWEAVEKALGREGTEPPFWAFCWAGGQALARWVLDHADQVRGRRVLDLGCGGGVAGIAAARAGAATVTANDVDPLALAMVVRNARLNRVQLELLSGDLLDAAPRERWDVILVGDLCYTATTARRVIDWLQRRAGDGCRVLLGDPGRAYRPDHGLEQLATYSVPTTRELEDRTVRETAVWQVLAR